MSFQKLEKSSPDLDLDMSQIFKDAWIFEKNNMKKCYEKVLWIKLLWPITIHSTSENRERCLHAYFEKNSRICQLKIQLVVGNKHYTHLILSQNLLWISQPGSNFKVCVKIIVGSEYNSYLPLARVNQHLHWNLHLLEWAPSQIIINLWNVKFEPRGPYLV